MVSEQLELDLMPLTERQLLREIRAKNCTIKRTTWGHSLVLDPAGNPISGYAVRHAKGAKKEVLDVYVRAVRQALSQLP